MEILNEITTPIGTLDELIQIGADPRKTRSCHPRTGSGNGSIAGCPWHRMCRFRQWRDQVGGLKGPLNIGVEIVLSPEDGRHTGQMEMACYQYYANQTRARQKQQDESGELIRILAYEGDGRSISEWETKHAPEPGKPDGDPKSPVMERVLNVHEVKPHKRPMERFPVVAAANMAKTELMDEDEREALRNALAKAGVTVPDREAQADVLPPVVGAPVKVGTKKGKE